MIMPQIDSKLLIIVGLAVGAFIFKGALMEKFYKPHEDKDQ
jgi:hypothetical protein